jgi:hypothetical protein
MQKIKLNYPCARLEGAGASVDIVPFIPKLDIKCK